MTNSVEDFEIYKKALVPIPPEKLRVTIIMLQSHQKRIMHEAINMIGQIMYEKIDENNEYCISAMPLEEAINDKDFSYINLTSLHPVKGLI